MISIDKVVTLRKMKTKEFPGYSKYFIEDYAEEIRQNYGHSREHSLELAEKSLKQSFPNGLDKENSDLFSIDLNSNGQRELIGYLWHSINTTDSTSFIYDFYIFPNFRSKGFGKKVIEELEKTLLSSGINQIKLRVAFNNKKALSLYEEIGFNITGFNMSKNL